MSAVETIGMGIVLDEGTATDFRRNGRDQPLVVPPGGGKPKAYLRASNAGKAVDETFTKQAIDTLGRSE